jgi:hypothetical protein
MAKMTRAQRNLVLLREQAKDVYGASLTASHLGKTTYMVSRDGEQLCRGGYPAVVMYMVGFSNGWDAAKDVHAQDAAGADL